MCDISKLTSFVKPYWKRSLATLLLLAGLVLMDLSIPRLIQRIIDQGIKQQNQSIVIHTALLMLGISVLSTLFALGNNMLWQNGASFSIRPAKTGQAQHSFAGEHSVRIIATFITYGQNFIHPLRHLANMYNSVQAALEGSERIFEIIDAYPEVWDAQDALPLKNIRGDVRFDHVSFG